MGMSETCFENLPYFAVGIFHFILGLATFAVGGVWLGFTFTLLLPGVDSTGAVIATPQDLMGQDYHWWVWLIFTSEIWAGFWFMLSGMFAMCVREKGKLEHLFILTAVLSMCIFAPAVIVFCLEMLIHVLGGDFDRHKFLFTEANLGGQTTMLDDLHMRRDPNDKPWIITFPIVGLAIGVVELVLSAVTITVCARCRPTV